MSLKDNVQEASLAGEGAGGKAAVRFLDKVYSEADELIRLCPGSFRQHEVDAHYNDRLAIAQRYLYDENTGLIPGLLKAETPDEVRRLVLKARTDARGMGLEQGEGRSKSAAAIVTAYIDGFTGRLRELEPDIKLPTAVPSRA